MSDISSLNSLVSLFSSCFSPSCCVSLESPFEIVAKFDIFSSMARSFGVAFPPFTHASQDKSYTWFDRVLGYSSGWKPVILRGTRIETGLTSLVSREYRRITSLCWTSRAYLGAMQHPATTNPSIFWLKGLISDFLTAFAQSYNLTIFEPRIASERILVSWSYIGNRYPGETDSCWSTRGSDSLRGSKMFKEGSRELLTPLMRTFPPAPMKMAL
mmetsp:Transcript_17730/g.28285  ORF Transcript_17730/g.28285 Transcript_17730/m.28285 type:complete len:214 (+) Transcript_17730:1578-2219(+)